MGNMHPICFGYMLNYNYIGSLPSPLSYETEDDDVDINEEKVNQVNGVTVFVFVVDANSLLVSHQHTAPLFRSGRAIT